MTKNECDFEEWFGALVMNLNEQGVFFGDRDAVRDDYESGRKLFDVADEIAAEYTY